MTTSVSNLPSREASTGSRRERVAGYLPLDEYGALGDGRSIALSGSDGSVDWWCVPDVDSPPLFDRLLDADHGGRFSIQPVGTFTVERFYLHRSNVLETVFTTQTGKARLTESMNSGTAGCLPWAELARRLDGLEGVVDLELVVKLGTRGGTVKPRHHNVGMHPVFKVDKVLGLLLHSDGIRCEWRHKGINARFRIVEGQREVIAIVAGEDEPLVVPSISDISQRIDISDKAWREWTTRLTYQGLHQEVFLRNALALKLLLFSPSGAIAAAATTSLPESMGGSKNYDYRYAWVRDAGYTIKAFLTAGAQAEAKAAFTWLLEQLRQHGSRVCYTLSGKEVPRIKRLRMPGYRRSRPVVTGNRATNQRQHGVYGDIFQTAAAFVEAGNLLDDRTGALLEGLADECLRVWRKRDAGMWELDTQEHYTMSKISCWQALTRAIELADQGQIPARHRRRWKRGQRTIKAWIERKCWSEDQKAFVMFPGSDKLDASLVLAVRFGFDGRDRLLMTLDAIDRELGSGRYHYRYSGMEKQEGCFVACSFWMIEARVKLGQVQEALERYDALSSELDRSTGIMSEMVDPDTGAYLGNIPQALTHLAHLMTLSVLSEATAGS